jgi:hypothetical protein
MFQPRFLCVNQTGNKKFRIPYQYSLLVECPFLYTAVKKKKFADFLRHMQTNKFRII